MKKILLTLSLFILTSYSYAQKTISVLSGTTWTFYEDFSTALRQAPSGATIYLPGGLFTIQDGSDTITKPLTIIGVGHFPDSTQATLPTIINGNIYFAQGSDFSTLSGINFGFVNSANIISGNNITISRCKIQSINFNTTGNIKNLLITESVLQNLIIDNIDASNFLVEKSIINLISGNTQITYRNNIIFAAGGQGIGNNYYVGNCVFENNIITGPGPYSFIYNSILRNNLLFVGNYTDVQVYSYNNIYNNTLDNTFIYVPNAIYDDSYNYRLKPASSGKNAGTDGTDIGIYGTTKPCKDGWVPPNPHISFKSIPSESLPNGTLPVNVKVVAQDR